MGHLRTRIQNGELTERSLARLTGISQPHIHNVLKGAKILSPELGASMVVVAIVSSRALRYQRLTSRVDRPLTVQEAETRDYQEIERLEKGGPIAIADYTLLNNGEEGDLLKSLNMLVDQLGLKP